MQHNGNKALGRFVKALRDEAGLSPQKFADKARLGRNSVANIETGRRQASIDQLLCMAKALDVEPYLLLDVYRYTENVFRKNTYYPQLIGTLTGDKLRVLAKFLQMSDERLYNTEKIIDLLRQRDSYEAYPPGKRRK